MFTVSENPEFIYGSPNFYKILGISQSDISLKSERLLDLVHPDDVSGLKSAIRISVSEKTPFNFAFRVIKRDGDIAWFGIRGGSMTEVDGAVRMIATLTDITPQKRASEDILLEHRRLSSVLRQTGALVWEADIAAKKVRLSDELAAMLGVKNSFSFDEVRSGALRTLISSESAKDYARFNRDVASGAEERVGVFLIKNAAGDEERVKLTYEIIRNDVGEPVSAVGVLTVLTASEPEIRIFEGEKRFLEILSPSVKGVFCADVTTGAVEMNTLPFAAAEETLPDLIMRCAEYLPVDDDKAKLISSLSRRTLTEHCRAGKSWLALRFVRKDASGVSRWTNLAARLIANPVTKDIYIFAYMSDAAGRAGNGPIPRPDTLYDGSPLLLSKDAFASATRELRASCTGYECAVIMLNFCGTDSLLRLHGADSLRDLMFTAGRLFRAAVNGITAIGTQSDGRLALFCVCDDGADELRITVEQTKDQLYALLTQIFPGNALTLSCGISSLCDSSVSDAELRRQAEIACDTSGQWPGNPVIVYTNPGVGSGEAESDGEDARQSVLVAQGDTISRGLLQNILSSSYSVDTASDADTAISMLRKKNYALLLADIQIPGKDDRSILSEIKSDPELSSVPVVIVTSDSEPETEIKALDMGASDVVVRPFAVKTLLSRVRNIIGRRLAASMAEKNKLYELRFQQQENSLRIARRDELTGLLNRKEFTRQAERMISAGKPGDYIIFCVNINNFKVVNDRYGHTEGDRLLRYVGKMINQLADNNSDVTCRHAADLFLVICRNEKILIKRFTDGCREGVERYDLPIRISVRFGLYVADEPELDVNLMIDRAIMAGDSIKGHANRHCAYYDDSLRKRIVLEQELTAEMPSALAKGQFDTWFQPQYNYETGEMIGAEALVRWTHPTRGILSPGLFVPLFESNGLISQLDEFVWERCCRFLRKWIDGGKANTPPVISVNISRVDIYNPRLCKKIKALVERYGLPPSVLRLEITESAYMDNPEQLIETIKQLREAGFYIEMDDFGSGYSSLNTLKDVPVDILKLDTRFLSSGDDDSRGGSILNSVIRMAHWLKLPIIAEGVETKQQADYLRSMNCLYMQGYFFGRPLPPDKFEELCASGRIASADRYSGIDLAGVAEFWDPTAQSALLFNSCIGGAAIVEFNGFSAELMRANDAFYTAIGSDREEYAPFFLNVLEGIEPEYRGLFVSMLKKAVESDSDAECEIYLLVNPKKNSGRWTRNRARLLARNGDVSIIYVTVEDITKRIRDEKRLNDSLHDALVNEEMFISSLGAATFVYDRTDDLLTVKYKGKSGKPELRSFIPSGGELPAALAKMLADVLSAPAGGECAFSGTLFSDECRDYHVRYTSVASANGEVNKITGFIVERGAPVKIHA